MKTEYKLLDFNTSDTMGSIYVTNKTGQADLSDKMYEFAGQKCKFFGDCGLDCVDCYVKREEVIQ